MAKGADAGMPDLDVLSRLFHPAQELFEVIRRQCRTCCKRACCSIDKPDCDEILFGIERAIRIKRHARRQRVLMQQDGVAIGCGSRGLGCGDHAASTPTFSITMGWPSAFSIG